MKAIKIISVLFTFFMILLYVYLVYDIHLNSGEYEQIYRISPSSEKWSNKSITNFLIKHYILLGLFFCGLIINIISFFKKKYYLEKICFIIFILLLTFLTYSLLMYFSDGYRH
jgi:hypothetical protein